MSWVVLFFYLGFLTRCEFYLDRFLMKQPLHQLDLFVMFVSLFLCVMIFTVLK